MGFPALTMFIEFYDDPSLWGRLNVEFFELVFSRLVFDLWWLTDLQVG